jgi:hypothetical protein
MVRFLPVSGAAVIALVGITSAALSDERVPVADLAHIHGIGFDPQQSSRLLLATHFGVYALDPGGLAAPLSETGDDFMGFTTVPGRNDLLVASGHPATGGNLGVIASVDGGVSWQQLSPGAEGPVDFHALSVSRANPAAMFGLFQGIQASVDGGRTWRIVGPGPEAVIDLAASAMDESVVFAATGAGLMRSSDGGRSWTLQGPAVPVTMVETAPDGSLYIFVAGAGLYRGDPAGERWVALSETLAGREFLHMAVEPGDAANIVAVTHASEVLESRDGGRTWLPFGSS